MAADYLLSGQKWAGPRAGFNPAGWISWIVGFAVGAFNLVADLVPAMADYRGMIPVPPLAALIVGFVLYCLFAKLGLESKKLELPVTIN
jgi:cytosine permease